MLQWISFRIPLLKPAIDESKEYSARIFARRSIGRTGKASSFPGSRSLTIVLYIRSEYSRRLRWMHIPLLFLLIGWTTGIHAQTVMNRDSLLRLLPSAKSDTAAVLLYINIGQQYEASDPSLARTYYLKADSLSKKIGYSRGIVKFISNYTFVLNMQGQYDSSILLNLQAVALSRKLGDSMLVGKNLMNTGTAYRGAGDYESAIEYYLQSEKIFDQLAGPELTAQVNDIIQVLYFQLHRYSEAISYGKKAVKGSRQFNDTRFLGSSLSNLSMSYQSTGQFDSALSLLKEALPIAVAIDNTDLEASILSNLSNLYLQQGDFQKSKPYIDKALSLFVRIESKEGESISLRNLGYYYFLQKDYSEAKNYTRRALLLTQESKLRVEAKNCFQLLSDIALAERDLDGYRTLRAQSDLLGDSILNEQLQMNVASLEKKYETEKKQSRIDRLESEKLIQSLSIQQSRQYNYILAGVSISLLCISLLVWRNYVQKQKLNRQSLQSMRAEQLLQHRISLEKERTRIATDMHDDMGAGLSRIQFLSEMVALKKQKQEPIEEDIDKIRLFAHDMIDKMGEIVWALNEKNDTLSDLIAYTRSYAVEYLSQHSIPCKVDIPIHFPATFVSGEFRRNIYLSIKEILHNIVKHARATNVEMQISIDQSLYIRIADNGIGFRQDDVRPFSNGLTNLKKRVDQLNGQIDIASQSGTEISITVPIA